MIPPAIRERYLRDPLPIRLGGLAADLARISSCSANPRNAEVISGLMEEGKYFAEWAAPEAEPDVQAALAEVQRWLAHSHRGWLAGRRDASLGPEAQRWSDRLLELSGLLSQ